MSDEPKELRVVVGGPLGKKWLVEVKLPRQGNVGRSRMEMAGPFNAKDAATYYFELRAGGRHARFVHARTLATEPWDTVPEWAKPSPEKSDARQLTLGGG